MKKIYTALLIFLFAYTTIKAQWSELGDANSLLLYGQIFSICSDATGNVYAAGDFINTNFKYFVAKYNGSSWSELGGTNSLHANNPIRFICSDIAGNIYAAGNFTNASGNRYVAKFNGSTWSELGGANSLQANGTIYSVFSDAAGNIYAGGNFTNANSNVFVAKYSNTTVPLSFISFTAELQNENTFLQWQTANEINVSHFNIQHSSNGIEFNTIQQTAAKNNAYNEYSITDVQPLNGTSYYRIEAVDKDGKTTYSKTEKVQLKIDKEQLTIFPNPATSVVNIAFKEMQQIIITDVTGRLLLSKQLGCVNNTQLNISTIGKGIFFVRAIGKDGSSETKKLLVQ